MTSQAAESVFFMLLLHGLGSEFLQCFVGNGAGWGKSDFDPTNRTAVMGENSKGASFP